jgi:hypothetical protein
MLRFLRFTVLIAAFAATIHGQVAAKHVEQSKPSPDHFTSPMELEFPLAVADSSLWGVGEVRRDSISRYVCDGVSFRDFSTEALKPRKGKVAVTFRPVLYAEAGVDKRVDISIDVLRGDAVIGSDAVKNLKLGEKKTAEAALTVQLATSDFEGSGALTVRMTTVVRDDP